MTTISKVLLDCLNELEQDDVNQFKWYLTPGASSGFKPIPRGKLENAKREDIVTEMRKHYGLPEAGRIAEQVLNQMQLNNIAKKLKEDLAAVPVQAEEAPSSASDAAGPPAAPGVPGAPAVSGLTQNITASDNSKVGAQVFSGNQFSGPVNLSF